MREKVKEEKRERKSARARAHEKEGGPRHTFRVQDYPERGMGRREIEAKRARGYKKNAKETERAQAKSKMQRERERASARARARESERERERERETEIGREAKNDSETPVHV